MTPLGKGGRGTGGYLTAILIAAAAVLMHVVLTSKPVAQASRGIYGFGDVILFFAMFGVLVLVPTAAALFYFRSYRHVRTVAIAVALALAVAVAGALLFLFGVL